MNVSLRRALYFGYGLALLALVSWFVADFPILRLMLAIGFLVYGACLWRWPWLWLVALPALLPLFDLASWSGRFFFDEFDALVLLTVAVLALREAARSPIAPLTRATLGVLTLLAASYFLSTLIRLWPLPPITVNSFADYDSPYNSLRVAKGFIEALLLLHPLRQAIAQNRDARLLLGYGLLVGLSAVALIAVYERWLFADVGSYRTTASFSSMHTGDGPIDVWLAMTMPFLGLFFFHRSWLSLLPLTCAIAFLSTYALFTTVSRGPVLAVLVAFGVGLLALLISRAHQSRVAGILVFGVGTAALVATFALPILVQSSLAQRFQQTPQDAVARLNHWRNSLALRDQSFATQLFGMGLGSFPAMHQQRSIDEARAARYRWVLNGANGSLTLWSGRNLYVSQTVATSQNRTYRFHARLQSSETRPSFTVILCEVWMLTSATCTRNGVVLQPPTGQWHTWSTIIHTNQVGSRRTVLGISFKRPTKLLFYVSDAATSGVDVADLSLTDANGNELLRNGDFARGADDWFWQVDDHLQWHTKNLVVNILFDQGWLGILAVGALLSVTLVQLARQVAGRDWIAAIFLASLAGFIVTGMTVSTFDQPRLALMFYLMCFAILVVREQATEK